MSKKSKHKHIKISNSSNKINFKIERKKSISLKTDKEYIHTGIKGFDRLITKGIPKGSSVLVSGGAGSGKTIFCLQTIFNHVKEGKKCIYMSFEESADRLREHMQDFGWDPTPYEKSNHLLIQRFSPFDVSRSIDALLMKAKNELMIEIEPVMFPEDFKPEIIVVDSLTAIGSAFVSKDESYRIYIEQLFRFFEKIGATSFLISETKEALTTTYSPSGIEEFLADGVVVLYNIRKGNTRESGLEILKLRGTKHEKKIVALVIGDKGIDVFPDQEVFGSI